MYSAVGSTELYPRTTAYCNSDGRFAQIASWQYCSMAWPTLLDCRLRELRGNHCATAGQAQTRTYPGQRSSTGSCVPNRFRLDTGPCVGTGGGLAKSGKEVQESSSSSHRRRCTLTTPSLKTPLRSA